jgi:hypothetical protein
MVSLPSGSGRGRVASPPGSGPRCGCSPGSHRARLDSGSFVALFELAAAERARLAQFRRLAALFWLLHLRPGGRASRRNPPGTLRRQAERLLALLG